MVAALVHGNFDGEVTEMELATRHFIRPKDLNHHETVYAGQLADWLTEAAMVGVTQIVKKNNDVVLATLKEMRVLKPITSGCILEFEYETQHLGTTSIEIFVNVKDMLSQEQYARGSAVFVTVDENGKKTPHGLM